MRFFQPAKFSDISIKTMRNSVPPALPAILWLPQKAVGRASCGLAVVPDHLVIG
jgi:hypothetical protein